MSGHPPEPAEAAGPPVTPGGRARARPRREAVLGAVAVGGVVGAEVRNGIGLAFPHPEGGWPWSTLSVNVSGCLLIGILLVVIVELVDAHPLVRPLLGVGVLGWYTTFSTFAVDTVQLAGAGHAGAAVAYAVATPVLAVLAVTAGAAATRGVAARRGAGRKGTRP